MLTIDLRLTIYAVPVLPLITIFFIVVSRQIERRYKLVQDQFGEVSARAQENFSGIRINEVMDHEPTIASSGEAGDRKGDPYKYHPSREKKGKGDVEFRHVSFAYGEREVLHDINSKVKAGSSLAVVGPTGSGKSTLVSLLPRVFDVTQGQVLIDGVDVREISLPVLRRQIGHVAQETFLFSVPF